MALLSVFAARKSAIAAQQQRAASAPSVQPAAQSYPPQFTDHDWRLERLTREAMDSVVHTHRWRITCIPSDRVARRFYMRGTLESVTHRANSIFTEPCLILVEPAPVQIGGESFDRRLSISP